MARGEMARFGMVVMVMLAVRVAGNFVVEENSLAVLSPEELQGTYQSSIGNFGVPKYGGTLSGLVMYPAVNLKGCDKFPNDYFRAKSGERPNFALVDRGGNVPSLLPLLSQNFVLSGNQLNNSILSVFTGGDQLCYRQLQSLDL